MIDDESNFSSTGCVIALALWIGLGLGVIATLKLFGDQILIDTSQFSLAFEASLVLLRPLFFLAAFTIMFAVGWFLGKGLLRGAENAAAGLALWMEDTRKKKKDEYTAHYDARLSEPEQDVNIAYYEDEDFSHLANK